MASDTQEVTVTIRLIRSFVHRNVKNVVYRNVDLQQKVDTFKQFVLSDLVDKKGIPPPFKKHSYDTFKIEYKAHGAKTNDVVINLKDDDTLILKGNKTLQECGVEHETDISFYKLEDYLKYKEDPQVQW